MSRKTDELMETLDRLIVSLVESSSHNQDYKEFLSGVLDVLYNCIINYVKSYGEDRNPRWIGLIKKKSDLVDYIIWFDRSQDSPKRKYVNEAVESAQQEEEDKSLKVQVSTRKRRIHPTSHSPSMPRNHISKPLKISWLYTADIKTINEYLSNRFIDGYSYLQHGLSQPAERELRLIKSALLQKPVKMSLHDYAVWKEHYLKLEDKIKNSSS